MNPSYFRVELGKRTATNRLLTYLNLSEIQEPVKTDVMEAIDKVVEDGIWKEIPLYFYENQSWTVFEDLSGWFSGLSYKDWLKFAEEDEFVLAGYNDAISYGQLIVIKNGKLIRDFLYDEQQPQDNVNFGKLEYETDSPINTWIDVASFVDEDELAFSKDGYLWNLRTTKI